MSEIEFGGGGKITRISGRPLSAAPAIARKFAGDPAAGALLQGYATRFGVPHLYQGRVEVFARGCFARSLVPCAPAVSLLIEHRDSDLLGTTADGLDLLQDEKGLAFRFHLPDTDRGREIHRLVAARALSGMSVSYRVEAEETQTIDDTSVRIIRDAHLREVSLCKFGAVNTAFAFATTIAAHGAPTFEDSVKSGAILAEESFVMLARSLARLRDRAEQAA